MAKTEGASLLERASMKMLYSLRSKARSGASPENSSGIEKNLFRPKNTPQLSSERKAVYRADKNTKSIWADVAKDGYIAQKL